MMAMAKSEVIEVGGPPSHGFPELWYSCRHQILGLAEQGYRTVSPDFRRFIDTDAPPSPSSYTLFHVVGDLVKLVQALGEELKRRFWKSLAYQPPPTKFTSLVLALALKLPRS